MSDLLGSSCLTIFNTWNPTKQQKHYGQTYFVSHHIHGWSASKDARPFSPVFRVVCRGWTGTTSQSWGDTRPGYWPGSVGWDMSGFRKPRNWDISPTTPGWKQWQHHPAVSPLSICQQTTDCTFPLTYVQTRQAKGQHKVSISTTTALSLSSSFRSAISPFRSHVCWTLTSLNRGISALQARLASGTWRLDVF